VIAPHEPHDIPKQLAAIAGGASLGKRAPIVVLGFPAAPFFVGKPRKRRARIVGLLVAHRIHCKTSFL
jgi:H+/Cl- antiporter ClcA